MVKGERAYLGKSHGEAGVDNVHRVRTTVHMRG